MKAHYFLSFLILFSVTSYAISDETKWKQAISAPETMISSDSEGFDTKRISLGYLPLYEHGDRNMGLKLETDHFDQANWTAHTNQISFVTKAINPRSALGYSIKLGLNDLSGQTLVTTDSQYSFNLSDKTRMELVINRDRLETQKSLDNHIYFTMVGIDVEQQIFNRLSIMGMISDMEFSDSNSRLFFRAKLVADVLPELGINLQLRYKKYHSTDINVEKNYFNPENYQETMAAIGYRKRINGWMLAGTLGLGRQRIDATSSTLTKLIEFNATSPFVGNVFFRTRLGFNQSGGIQGPDYSYKYLTEELTFSF